MLPMYDPLVFSLDFELGLAFPVSPNLDLRSRHLSPRLLRPVSDTFGKRKSPSPSPEGPRLNSESINSRVCGVVADILVLVSTHLCLLSLPLKPYSL